jgi:hypothetical protein
MTFANGIKYNLEHHHDKEGALFTVNRYRDEVVWSILEGNVDVDDIYARLCHADGNIESYVPVKDYLKACFDEGYFYPGYHGDIAVVLMSYQKHCREYGIEVPAHWQLPIEDRMTSIMTFIQRGVFRSGRAWAQAFLTQRTAR